MNGRSGGLLFSGFSLWMVVAALGLYTLWPLFVPGVAQKPIKFGIDLVGGTYLSLLVNTDKAVEDALFDRVRSLEEELQGRELAPSSVTMEKDQATMVFESNDRARQAAEYIRGSGMTQKVDQSKVSLSFDAREIAHIKRSAVDSNIQVLRKRLDKFAVAEVSVVAQGEKTIVIELPNVDDPAQAKSMIGKAAQLEFALVAASGRTKEDILEKYDGELPDGMRIVPHYPKRGRGVEEYYLIPKHNEITGRMLRDAKPGLSGKTGGLAVDFELSAEGDRRFYDITNRGVGKLLAIVLDNEVIEAARINEPIKGGHIQITGDFDQERSKELADLLKSGAYAAPVKFDEDRTVGPSLGAKAIRQGIQACAVGLGLLFLFSVVYYKLPGLFAFLTLMYNLLLILLALSYFGGTLTLPGIAGLVLTLGMAIDSSILIYERIKEELRAGVALGSAIHAGFSGALTVILDANITTFIMGVVLFKFGTGPVQGFAITLMIGIITTLITGLFFLRSLFSFVISGLGVHKMKF